MTLPQTVRIGPILYTVEQPDSIPGDDGDEKIGQIRFMECRILIRSGMPADKEVTTFWHELVHGILENSGHNYDDEELVDALAYGIVNLFLSNGWRIEVE